MINKIYFITALVASLIFSTVGSPLQAGTSLSDVLTDICVAPLCKDYSGNNRIVSSDGTKIAAKDWSPLNKDKPTFLLLHGYPHGQGLWISQILSQLPIKYRLVTMDIRGGGGSDVPAPGNYEAVNLGNDIQAVINTLKLKNVILVGHSAGGISINAYVATHGLSQVKGIIEVSAVPDLVNAIDPPAIANLVGLTLSSDPVVFIQATKDFAAASHYKPFPQFLTDALVNMDLQVPLLGRIGQITAAFTNSDSVGIIRTINVPVLLIHGAKDGVILPATSTFFQTNLISSPKVQRTDLPDTGHLPQLESPLQFNKAISSFADSLR
jgi:non-heme chloroperoxidase